MTTQGFVASHAKDAQFERGLRSFYEYRDLGINRATAGRVDAHVIRAAAGKAFSSQPHFHKTEFQLVYILKGWIDFEYEGQGIVRLEAGSCVHQPPGIRHRELGHSEDIEMLEVVVPAGFATEEVDTVNDSFCCPHCGDQVIAAAAFCHACGRALADIKPTVIAQASGRCQVP